MGDSDLMQNGIIGIYKWTCSLLLIVVFFQQRCCYSVVFIEIDSWCQC